jgi:hypothetical protein
VKTIRNLVVAAVLAATGLSLAGCPLPGENSKPVPTYTPAPAWSWPYGKTTTAPDKGKAVPPGHPHALAPVSFTWPKPTTTPVSKRVIEVVDKVGPSKWNVGQAMNWLDRYTGSDMRLASKCSGHAWRCITVRGGNLPGRYLGYTSGDTIVIDTAKVDRHGYRSNYSRERILAHELGHANGYGHSARGHNLMRPVISQIRLYLTPSQRRFFAAR